MKYSHSSYPVVGPIALLALATISLFGPAAASAATCNTVAACVLGQNAGAGLGVAGTSSAGDGVYGTTTYAATAASGAKAGVFGIDHTSSSKSTFNFGTFGSSTFGTGAGGKSNLGVGVLGTSTSGYGVYGTSAKSNGVTGTTFVNATSPGTGKTGVSGLDASTNNNKYNSGVYGFSAYANGVHAKSTNGYGLYAESQNGTGAETYGFDGLIAKTPYDDSMGFNYIAINADSNAVAGTGLFVTAGAAGIVAGIDDTESIEPATAIDAQTGPSSNEGANTAIEGDTGNGTASMFNASGSGIGVFANASSGLGVFASAGSGVPLVVYGSGAQLMTASNSQKDVLSLDSAGNLTLSGTLTSSGTPAFRVSRSDGRDTLAYGPRTTEATLEDFGEATLVNGVARIALDPAFMATIDAQRPYLVFLTPQGDNAGLYVSEKSARGFTVREHAGGRSNILLDYRIVARPFGERSQRLPVLARPVPGLSSAAVRVAQMRTRQAREARFRARVWQSRTAAIGRSRHAPG